MSHYITTETGHFISSRFQYLAEVLQDYDATLELRWIPPDNRNTPHEQRNPWAVFQRGQVVFLCSEKDEPHKILARVIAGDRRQGDPLQRMDEAERVARQLLEFKEMEEMAQAKDEMAFLIDNANRGKHYISHNGKKLDGESLREVPNSGRVILP